jgi:hypothetical protein
MIPFWIVYVLVLLRADVLWDYTWLEQEEYNTFQVTFISKGCPTNFIWKLHSQAFNIIPVELFSDVTSKYNVSDSHTTRTILKWILKKKGAGRKNYNKHSYTFCGNYLTNYTTSHHRR